jgi:hypothetical protein
MPKNKDVLEIREKFEECGHALSLFIDLSTSDIAFTERSKLALIEYGIQQMQVFETTERQLSAAVQSRAGRSMSTAPAARPRRHRQRKPRPSQQPHGRRSSTAPRPVPSAISPATQCGLTPLESDV